jgi:hypothetical protein
MPFMDYVQSDTSQSKDPANSPSLVPFLGLPYDIKLLVYQACDMPTLFRLMHTSPAIREDAEQAFWSHQIPWYVTDNTWLRNEYGYPGSMLHCPDFASRVQQVEVQFTSLEEDFYHDQSGEIDTTATGVSRVISNKRLLTLEQQAQEFWQAFQQNFPAARRVVLNNTARRMKGDSIPHAFKAVVTACSYDLDIRVALADHLTDEFREECQKNVYKLNGSTWELIKQDWTNDRIQLPPKKFSGPVGNYQQILWREKVQLSRSDAIRFARIQLLENLHFNETHDSFFDCPDSGCRTRLEKRKGEWSRHVKNTWHDMGAFPEGEQSIYLLSVTPAEVDELLYNAERDLLKENVKTTEARDQMRQDQKKSEIEKDFLKQLETDPMYRNYLPAQDSVTYLGYLDV